MAGGGFLGGLAVFISIVKMVKFKLKIKRNSAKRSKK